MQPKIVSRRTDQTRLRKYGTTRQTRNYITTIEDYLDDNPWSIRENNILWSCKYWHSGIQPGIVSGIFSLYRSHNNNPFHAIVHKVIMMQMYIKCNKRDFLQDTLINIPPENGHDRYLIISEVFVPCNKGRLLRRGKKHEIACTSWSYCLWKLCELVSNIEEQLCIVFRYTWNLYHLHDLATQALVSFTKRRGNIYVFEWNKCLCLAIWKWFKKCVHLKCICVWCLDNWFCQVSLLTHFPWQC